MIIMDNNVKCIFKLVLSTPDMIIL
jgi:hypothetical protein